MAIRDRRSDLLTANIRELRSAVRGVKERQPFHIDAWVVLPDHIHAIWTLPEGDHDYSRRWRLIKAEFSKSLAPFESRSEVMLRRGERGIWQNRFWEHTVRDERDYAAHMDYTHFNPVKHGLVGQVADWPYSSFRRCVARGIYPADWVADAADLPSAGE